MMSWWAGSWWVVGVVGLMLVLVALVSSSTFPCPRSSGAGMVHRAKPQVEAGPGQAVHGAELQASLPSCTPDPGEGGEEAEGSSYSEVGGRIDSG